MLRLIFLCTCLSIPSAISVAQIREQRLTIAVTDDAVPHSQVNHVHRGAASNSVKETRISLVRLREPRKAQRLYEQAMNAWMNHKQLQAQRKLDQALKIYPNFPEALALYGGFYGDLQRWTAAEQSLQAAMAADPEYSPAYTVMAGIYNAQKRFDDAQTAAEQALSIGDHSWDVHYEMARAFIGKEQYERALVVTEEGLRIKQHGSLLHLAKAHALLGLRRYRPALTELRAFILHRPKGEGAEHARDLLDRVQAAAGE